jgi:hypothetical protein
MPQAPAGLFTRDQPQTSVFVSFALFKSDSYRQGLATKKGMDATPKRLSAANDPHA